MVLSDEVIFADFLLTKEAHCIDVYTDQEVSICFLPLELVVKNSFEFIEENKEFLSFEIDETIGIHRFCRQGDRNRISELTIYDLGHELKFNGDNFLQVTPSESVFLDIFPRALFPYLSKNFHELESSTRGIRYILQLIPPDAPTPPPASENSEPKKSGNIPLKKNHFVHNVSMELRLTIVNNYFKDIKIHLNPDISIAQYQRSPYWNRWEMHEQEMSEFKFHMLLFSGTSLNGTCISNTCWYLDTDEYQEQHALSLLNQINQLANTSLLEHIEYNPETQLLHFTVGDRIAQWKGNTQSKEELHALLKLLGEYVNSEGRDRKFYFIPHYSNGLILYLNPNTIPTLQNQFCPSKNIYLLEEIPTE